ncbi:hypothetical protein BJ508DRAFT_381606 [Ascobolus immersus RN42]|uniref:Uncharacterized protein n=1 Tax=Ascobolus immersus RN42 TaxID=1160509 RepID=A0A3N4HKC4_ASCIM|nr:hypothetical protein BJ508DRAFT_381606 [Ascobolus immersus RN42]
MVFARRYSALPQTPTYDAFEYDDDDRVDRTMAEQAEHSDDERKQTQTQKPKLLEMEFGLMGGLDLGESFGKSERESFEMRSEDGGRSVGGKGVLVDQKREEREAPVPLAHASLPPAPPAHSLSPPSPPAHTSTILPQLAPGEREADLAKRYAESTESIEERPGLIRKQSTLRVHVVDDSDDDGRRRRPSDVSILERAPTPPPHGTNVDEETYGQLEFSRPTTPGSLFRDFDGVHCEPVNQTPRNSVYAEEPKPDLGRRRSSQTLSAYLGTPGRARPQSGMVYYPAPVPAVLNLPPLLSQHRRTDSSDHQSPNNNRRSMAFPGPTTPGQAPPMELPKHNAHDMTPRRASRLPPSVRASMMLDPNQPNIPPLELTSGSAHDTLESILDASAEAPPVAFTDHPMSGAPAISYRHSKMPSAGSRLSLGSPLSTLSLGGGLNPLATPPTPGGEAVSPGPDGGLPPSQPPSPHPHPQFQDESILPTTLLAELESRKANLKSRSRTAGHVNPHGIRSTLLELDAVAEVAQVQRRGKTTHLAWQADEEEGDADEDVPLGVLYGKKETVRVGGLLAEKEREDSEPLSKRRARLRAEKGLTGQLRGEEGDEDVPLAVLMAGKSAPEEDEKETLAQRKARLKNQLPKPDFGSSISLDLAGSGAATPAEEEETLAQRRARLKREKEQRARVDALQMGVRSQTLMNQPSRQSLLGGLAQGGRGSYYAGPGKGLVASTSNLDLRGSFYPQQGMGQQQQFMMQQQMMMAGGGGQMMAGQQYVNPQAMQGGAGLHQLAMQQGFVPLDQKQRDMVERWRESVM